MSFLNLMGNKLKPKEVNEVLEELTNAIAQLNNIVSSLPTLTASNVTYDNTSSGLTADDVQTAIDEVNGKIKGWSLIGNTAYEGTSLDVSNYDEIYIVPKMQGTSPQNPIFVINNSGTINYGFMVNSSYGFEFQTTINNGTMTISAQVLHGWTSATYDIYGK